MASFNNNTDLFIGKAELSRLIKFMDQDGFRQLMLKNSGSFGIIRYEADANGNNFKVEEDVLGSGNIKIASKSFAIDETGNLIVQDVVGSIAVANDSAYYWVKIAHKYKTTEGGSVNIDANGNLTGTATIFTDVLRGAPNFPSKISFPGSSNNPLEYEVVEVLNDTTVILDGSFIPENNLTYQVVGTFTPGAVPTLSEKYPFQYDGCDITLEAEVSLNTAPVKSDGTEFYIARVVNTGGNVAIEDKRTEFWKSSAEFKLNNILKTANPLIGVEWIKYDQISTSRDKNIVNVGWGIRSKVWTSDSEARTITFSGAIDGGKYKTTNQFSNDELNGWRVYFKNGSYGEIYDSAKVGSDIKCFIKTYDPDQLTSGDQLVVVPAVDTVELKAIGDGGTINVVNTQVAFPSSDGYGQLKLPVPTSGYKYVIQYRYHKSGETTQWLDLPSDNTNGFYNEDQFDNNGNLIISPSRTVYTTSNPAGFIPLLQTTSSYQQFTASLQSGDKFGYTEFELDNGAPGNLFTVGTDSFVQRCKGVRGGGSTTTNHIVGLSNTNAKVGNSFTFIFDVGIKDGGFSLTINSGFTNIASPGTVIRTFTAEELDFPFLTGKNVAFRCTYTGTAWQVYQIEGTEDKLGDIKMVNSITNADFPAGKATLGTKHQGWALCNGANGTVDLRERFVAGSNYGVTRDGDYGTVLSTEFGTIGSTGGGIHSYKLTAAQSGSPVHFHNHTFAIQNESAHTHGSGSLNISVASGAHTHETWYKNIESGSGDIAPQETGNDQSFTIQSLGSAHTHPASSFSGSTAGGTAHKHDLHGSVTANTAADAADYHENRPLFITLGFIQRVKQS